MQYNGAIGGLVQKWQRSWGRAESNGLDVWVLRPGFGDVGDGRRECGGYW